MRNKFVNRWRINRRLIRMLLFFFGEGDWFRDVFLELFLRQFYNNNFYKVNLFMYRLNNHINFRFIVKLIYFPLIYIYIITVKHFVKWNSKSSIPKRKKGSNKPFHPQSRKFQRILFLFLWARQTSANRRYSTSQTTNHRFLLLSSNFIHRLHPLLPPLLRQPATKLHP